MAILFEIYREGHRAKEFVLKGAYVTGPESVPVDGHVYLSDGVVVVDPPTDVPVEPGGEPPSAYGLALLWDAGEAGSFVLETTRLPPREQPYILNVELARHRLMRIVHKQEDWNYWEGTAPASARDALRKIRDAQLLFAESLSRLENPGEAARLADEALAAAVQASEDLAVCQAEASGARRRAGASGARVMFGVRSDPAVRSAKYRGTLARFFDYAIVPVSWRSMQPEEDRFETEAADSTVEFLARNRIPIIAGPLLSLAEGQVPEWLFIYEHDFEALRDLAFDYVRSVVTRYRRIIRVWNVVSGLHVANGFGLSFEQMLDLTRLLVGQVKAVNPQAKTVVSLRMPFGEYLATPSPGAPGVPPHLYAEMVAQSGVECDGFGLELEIGLPRRGSFCRDLFQISAVLERFATLGKPVFLTAVACPDRTTGRDGVNPSDAGRWHSPWSPQVQAQWLREIYRIALSKPFIENVAWADLCDESTQTMMPGGGLLDDMLRPKPAFDALQELRRIMRPPQPAPGQAPMPAGTIGHAGVPAGAIPQGSSPAPAPPLGNA